MAKKRFRPIIVPKETKVMVAGTTINVQGPLGTLTKNISPKVKIEINGDSILIRNRENSKESAAQQGTMRSHLENMIRGVIKGFEKILIIEGTGYRAQLSGMNLQLFLGYSKPKTITIPKGIKCELKVIKSAEKGDLTYITITGTNKELVGDVAAEIKRTRKPDPYKHKGVRYADEVLKKKVGKRAVVQA
jgi:large subunit ribosomal protein L6